MAYPRPVFSENFILVWLDSDINEDDDCTRNSAALLKEIVGSVKIFIDVDRCIDFISEIADEKIFIIISSKLSQSLVPRIEQFIQLNSIYILSDGKLTHEEWVTHYKKVKGMFTLIKDVCNALKQNIRLIDNNLTPISIITPSSTTHLDELDQSFMYSQLLKEIILETPYDDKAKKELVDFYRVQYVGNDKQLKVIKEFEETYNHSSSIRWYTQQYFIYSILNQALRTQNTEVVMKMAFFLRDLHYEIERLYRLRNTHDLPHVYRGQGMLTDEFDKIRNNMNGLLSFNNFLSTSTDRAVGYIYADSADPDLVRVLFQIEINQSHRSNPYAFVSEITHYQQEEEVLFTMHAVFRIVDVREIEDRLWQVNLTMTDDKDPLLTTLTEHMRQEIKGSTGMLRMGNLMIKMGKYDKAEEIYNILLDKTSDNDLEAIAHLHHQLGISRQKKGDLHNALSFYEKVREIMQKYLPPDHPNLPTLYENIGVVYKALGEYSKAMSYYHKALEMAEKLLPPSQSNLATIYCNIGLLHNEMGQYSIALSHYAKALEIQQNCLPSNHPSLSVTYNNIALAYDGMGDYLKALSYYEKTLEMQQKSLPPDHPLKAITYGNIALIYSTLEENSKALLYYEETLKIQQKSLSSNHLDLAITYGNIGSSHKQLEEYLTALSYYEKALVIQQKALPADHPALATTYSNIGLIYDEIGEYSRALSYYEKTLEIQQKSLPLNHPSVAATSNNIGAVYYSIQEYSTSLSYYVNALQIQCKSLPPNHPDMCSTYNNIGLVFSRMERYSNALSNFEKALEIQQTSLPSNHTSLAATYNNIGSVYHCMKQYPTALSYYEKTLDIKQQSLPVKHQSMSVTHYNIASILESLQRYEEAIQHAEQAVASARQALGSDHQQVKEYQKYLKFLREKR